MDKNYEVFTDIIYFYDDPAKADVVLVPAKENKKLTDENYQRVIKIYEKNNGNEWNTISVLSDDNFLRISQADNILAGECRKLINKYRRPVISDWLITLAIFNMSEICWILEHQNRIKTVFLTDLCRPKLDKTNFILEAKKIMKKNSWEKAYLLS